MDSKIKLSEPGSCSSLDTSTSSSSGDILIGDQQTCSTDTDIYSQFSRASSLWNAIPGYILHDNSPTNSIHSSSTNSISDYILNDYSPVNSSHNYVSNDSSPASSIPDYVLFDSSPANSFLSLQNSHEESEKQDGHKGEKWVFGTFGSKNSNLIFRSSALADTSAVSIQKKPAFKLHITYRVSQAESKLLSKLLDCHGVTETVNQSGDFNLLWTGNHLKPDVLRALGAHQRVNHFPRSYELTRKDRLYKNIEVMQHSKGFKHFDFVPQTYVMPAEFRELNSAHFKLKGPWIVKPVASSRGRGIFIVESPNQVPLDEPVVVAKYIAHPLLVDGHKCDIRLYVAVTSFDPLVIYIYEEGLVRFATVKYDSSHKQLWNPCMHLCNYSINKYHSDYVKSEDPSIENFGHKWTLSALLRYLKERGQDTGLLMSQIEDLVIKAIIASSNSIVAACKMFVPHINNCFELYGFDILIDKELKPWLLEVNLSPSLGCDTALDVRLKSAMLADLLTLVGIPAVDPLIRCTSNSSTSSKRSLMKNKSGSCRRICSADGISNHQLHRKGRHGYGNQAPLSLEDSRLLRSIKSQFQRRGGFVRIFPCIDSWVKYSPYLDPISGIPTPSSASVYQTVNAHNLNLLVYTHLFPDVPITDRMHFLRSASTDRKRDSTLDLVVGQQRQTRYERMLKQGHCTLLMSPPRELKDSKCDEIKKQICEMLLDGKRLTQNQARRTFSQYLKCVLKRIAMHSPAQDGHVELVLKFLQKATNYLQSSFVVQTPSHKLSGKDRAAIVAKQLNDFLFVYNRETEVYSNTAERLNGIPNKLIVEFLCNAREEELEEVLSLQTMQPVAAASENPDDKNEGAKTLPLPAKHGHKSGGGTAAVTASLSVSLLKTLPIETAPGTRCLKKPIVARRKYVQYHNAAKH